MLPFSSEGFVWLIPTLIVTGLVAALRERADIAAENI